MLPVNFNKKNYDTRAAREVTALSFRASVFVFLVCILVQHVRPPSALASSLLQFKGLNPLDCETLVALAISLLQFKELKSLTCETLVA